MKVLVALLVLSASLSALQFKDIAKRTHLYFYAGNINPKDKVNKKFIGLSLSTSNRNHIRHDITRPFPLPDNCVDIFQAEDVLEHIEYETLPNVLNEIYRILKPEGYARISIPDYRCDVLRNRSEKDAVGKIYFDPDGGGRCVDGQVVDGGHVWFPTIEKVKALLDRTDFSKLGRIEFYHYYDEKGQSVTRSIDYSKGFVKRTPDHDRRVQNPYRAMSLVFDLFKR